MEKVLQNAKKPKCDPRAAKLSLPIKPNYFATLPPCPNLKGLPKFRASCAQRPSFASRQALVASQTGGLTHPPEPPWCQFGTCAWHQIAPIHMSRGPNSKMPSPLTLGKAWEPWARFNGGGRQEVAGGGAGEVLEERGEGAQPRHRPSLEVVPHWVRQAGLVYNCSIISHIHASISF